MTLPESQQTTETSDSEQQSAVLWFKRFKRVLESDEAEAVLMLQTKDQMSLGARQRLARLQKHYSIRATATRPKASKDIKWSSILNLKVLEDPRFVAEHLARHEWPEGYSEATAFLWDLPDESLLLNKPLDRDHDTGHNAITVAVPQRKNGWMQWARGPNPKADSQEVSAMRQNIHRRVNFTYDTGRDTRVQHCRQLFTMLMWYDFIKCIWPGVSGSRIGPQMREELEPVVKHFFADSSEAKVAKITTDIGSWCQVGRKLHETLCHRFGEAALFVLEEQLSSNFIEHRMTLTGGPMEKAMEHLARLGLEALSSRSDLQVLAQGIRKMLSAPFADVTEYCKINVSGYKSA